MRNLLRLETKGCPKEKEDEVGRGRGGAYVIFRIRGGEEERLWGIPWEIPIQRRERDEARRGSVCFGRS
jgi:hypothetical protein